MPENTDNSPQEHSSQERSSQEHSLPDYNYPEYNHENYNYKVVRQFAIMTVVWGIVGMLVGVLLAAQLAWPAMNFDVQYLHFGRLRPLHTNAVIFAFGGSALMSTSLYIVQRTCQVRLFSDQLAAFVFWGWQLVIVLAAITLPMGLTTSKEYAELEWPIDILITIVWVAYAIVFFGTIAKRKTRHIYVANWFFSAFIIAVAILHIFNSLAIPVTMTKSYSIYAGTVDAMVQWWYGHNAVGFFLTAGFLGMMYYFVPKQANRPVYSYRLSVVHFWALIAIYVWAGPHHLHYTTLPDWVQSLGMAMSLVLLAPSWGGMINGIMTLSGAWDKLRTDPILKFLVVSLSFYGMSTFEGPMMAIKSVNSLSHYTDWTIGHVHSGALGWVAMISIGSLYHLIPILFGRKQGAMYSEKLIDLHFWMATIGTVLYIASMWVNGLMQGLMWRAVNTDGTLTYSFVESVEASFPGYVVRFLGGFIFLAGMFVMAYNVWKTTRMAPQMPPQMPRQQAAAEVVA
jgi:cytochrome c oxidase cbb3-type subunit 1